MIRSIASRKAIVALFTAAWSIFGAQSGYGQLVEEGKIYWTHPESGIHRSSLDGSNVEQLVIPDLRRPDKIALDIAGGKMYWTEREVAGIHRADLNGSNLEKLVEGYRPPRWNRIIDLALDVAGGKIYWMEKNLQGDYSDFIMARANLDGSNIEVLIWGLGLGDIALDLARGKVYWTYGRLIGRADLDSLNSLNYLTPRYEAFEYFYPRADLSDIALDVDGGKIYWTDAVKGTIQRDDLDSLYWTDLTAIQWDDPDGQNVEEVLAVSDGYPEKIILLDSDRGQIYWTNPGTQTIQRADLDGQNVEPFFDLGQLHLTESLAGVALDLDGGKIYWADAGPEHWSVLGTGTIHRADLDGQNREVLFDPIVRRPHGIALGIDKMYWTDVMKGTIHQADLNGQNREVLVTGLDEPRGIALIAGSKIYWADSGTGKIQAAGLDGSQVEDIVIGLEHPSAIALDEDRAKIYWTESDNYPWGTSQFFRSNLDGSHIENVSISTRTSSNIALDEDRAKIYWTSVDSVFRSNLDGTNVEGFLALPYAWSFGAIALDSVGNEIYWTGLHTPPYSDGNNPPPRSDGIFRSNLDGSNVEQVERSPGGYYLHDIYVYYTAPTDIALYIPHPTAVSTPSTTPAIPSTTSLDPNFPNPFNASTQIAYHLATSGPVRLTIYNTLGQPVRTLVNQFQPAGFYQVRWDARDQRGTALAAGVYLVRPHHLDKAQTRRLLYLK